MSSAATFSRDVQLSVSPRQNVLTSGVAQERQHSADSRTIPAVDESRPKRVDEFEPSEELLHQLGFPRTQFEGASRALNVPGETLQLKARPAPKLILHRPPARPAPSFLHLPSRQAKKSPLRRFGRGLVSLILSLAVIGGGVFVFQQLISGPAKTEAPKPEVITIRDTNGVPVEDPVATYSIPEFIGFTTPYVTTEVIVDSLIYAQPVAGTMGSSSTGAWYVQFQEGPSEVAGRDLMNAGSGDHFCSRPTGAAEFTCDRAVERPIFLDPYMMMSSISTLVAFVPATARPFAAATFAGEAELNGINRSYYEIQIDGSQFQTTDPTGFAEWSSALLIDVAGTVRLQLWIDANQMVWKSDVRTDGYPDHRSLTVIRADQEPLVIPFVHD